MKNSHREVKKIWGSETWISNSHLYCGKILTINPGFRCSLHYHRLKTETFLVVEGEVRLEVIDNSIRIEWKTAKAPGDAIMKTGESFTIRPFLVHRFSSATPGVAKVIEFSTQHFEEDSYRLEESGPIPPGEVV